MTDQSRENATLTTAEIALCRPISSGRHLRAFCPFHGSDKQRSLSIDPASGRFNCFNCGAWGYTEEKRREFNEQKQQQKKAIPFHHSNGVPPAKTTSDKVVPAQLLITAPVEGKSSRQENLPSGIDERTQGLYEQYRRLLAGSPGEQYLKERAITLETAERCGLGYAPPGQWAHRSAAGKSVRDWRGGRLVFPHTDPEGSIVNLYGRAIGTADEVPKELRHDHLTGAKGYFNGRFLNRDEKNQTVYVCEGPFDAISLIEAGYPNTVAIFGVFGWRWEWARFIDKLIVAFDADEGGSQWKKIAEEAIFRGREVHYLPPEAYAGCKDLSEAWARYQSFKLGKELV